MLKCFSMIFFIFMNFTFSIKAQNDLENIISFEEYGSEIKQSPVSTVY